MQNKRAIYHIYNSLSRDVFERYLMEICLYTVTAGALLKSDREEAYLCLITAATASSPMGRTRL